MIKVVNVKNEGGSTHYCGRPYNYLPKYGKDFSVLGNPFKHNDVKLSIHKYRQYLVSTNDPEIINAISKLKDIIDGGGYVALGCFCKPFDCHCDVIKEIVENE